MKQSPAWTAVLSLIPVLVLITLLAINIGIFGSDAILGASQVALLVSSGVCVLLAALFFKTPWKEFEKAIGRNFSDIAGATLILFLIGGVSGTWTMSGVVPTFIYYGVKIISPKVFLLSACVICAVISVMTGSSWTTIATIGVALLGIGRAEGFSDGIIAGAIISGAYFGDKISPLSDTTVMASSVNKVPLFTHIRYMFFTTVPSIVITLIIFTVLGLSHDGSDASQIDLYTSVLAGKFHITPWLFLVPVITLVLIWRRMPALPVLAISVLAAALAALVFQPGIIADIGAKVTEGSRARILLAGTVESIYNTLSLETGHPEVDGLLATRGMLGMLNTVFLILCAMCQRYRLGPVPVHPADFQYLPWDFPRAWLRGAPAQPLRRGLRYGDLAALPLVQLRHDPGHHPFRSHPRLRPLLFLQPDQPPDVHLHRGHRLEDREKKCASGRISRCKPTRKAGLNGPAFLCLRDVFRTRRARCSWARCRCPRSGACGGRDGRHGRLRGAHHLRGAGPGRRHDAGHDRLRDARLRDADPGHRRGGDPGRHRDAGRAPDAWARRSLPASR